VDGHLVGGAFVVDLEVHLGPADAREEVGGSSRFEQLAVADDSCDALGAAVLKLVEPDGMSGDDHCSSVAIDGNVLLAGAPFFEAPGSQPSVDSRRACTHSLIGGA
jgi:hypothetical protein